MAVKVIWGDALKREYQNLFDTCRIHSERVKFAETIANQIAHRKELYRAIAKQVNAQMPWWFVGAIHHMECGLDLAKHLHNGDPLSKRTVRVPANRPATGEPPFTFEQSALDALRHMGFATEADWSMSRILYRLEGFNGYGYRQYHPTVKSPYLWSFTHHYVKGKYVADGKWNGEAVSQQLGIAAIIKRGFELKIFT